MLLQENGGVQIDLAKSLFVGDAAGRPEGVGRKKDFSCSDRLVSTGIFPNLICHITLLKVVLLRYPVIRSYLFIQFALNVGVPFYTEEEFFCDSKKQKFSLPTFDPRNVSLDTALLTPETTPLPASSTEVIVMVGAPACKRAKPIIPIHNLLKNNLACFQLEKVTLSERI